MKKILWVCILLTGMVHAQVPVKQENIFQKEISEISVKEMQAKQRLLQRAELTGKLTVASNNFNVHYHRCEWKVDPAMLYINGAVTSHFKMTAASDNIIFDLNRTLTVDSVLYHGSKISYQQTPEHALIIQFPAMILSGVKDSVAIYYQGIPDASGFGSFVKMVHGGSTPVLWTLSEPYGAREWWPCKNGLSDKTDSIDIIITNPAVYTASSNGALVSEVTNGINKTTTYKHRYPIATYLVAIAVTNYQVSTDTVQLKSQPLLYKGYYYPESFVDFKNYESYSKEFLLLFSNLFIEYPFVKEKYAQTQFSWGGGMEHQTNSFMGSRSPNLQSHELMHQWFGNLVTCGSWSDIWLNEGFATYGTALTLEYNYPSFHRDYLSGMQKSIFSATSGSVYVADTLNVSRLFSSRLTYNKGAYVVHMLRWKLGDSAFYRGVRRYLTDPVVKYGFATTADLKRNMELESKTELDSFFDKWIYGEGYANYQVTWSQNNNNWVTLTLNQTTSHNSVNFYDMPVQLELKGPSSSTTVVVDHRFNGQQFSVYVGFKADTVIIDPNLWLLANIKTSNNLPASKTANNVLIYPNPSPDKIYVVIQNPTDSKIQLQLINPLGQVLFTKQVTLSGNDEYITLPLANLPKGEYWLKLKGDKIINKVEKVVRR